MSTWVTVSAEPPWAHVGNQKTHSAHRIGTYSFNKDGPGALSLKGLFEGSRGGSPQVGSGLEEGFSYRWCDVRFRALAAIGGGGQELGSF